MSRVILPGECSCSCHRGGALHIMPCCDSAPKVRETFLDRLLRYIKPNQAESVGGEKHGGTRKKTKVKN